MTVELTTEEAQILIAVLTFAEGAALVEAPAIVEAMRVLRPWRSALLLAYLRSGMEAANEGTGGRAPSEPEETR